ncbi:histidinol-phosphatase HisJ family protein [Ruminococcaceae bacterium OttesenSCG-928-I18]|nr:histidinol-phosphatase HisJ family protein [Ruminococcaceae bacterium OttesenSCG-928-I18]
MRLPDYHVHSYFSADSNARHLETAQAAKKRGITDLCFTDHMDLGHSDEGFNRIPDFEGMQLAAKDAQEKVPEMHIRCGLEAGYLPQTAEKTAEVISKQKLDYVILSTHVVNGVDCVYPEIASQNDQMELYRDYLKAVYDSVTDPHIQDFYDCVGHLGYVAKWGHYVDNTFSYDLFPSLIDEILLAVIESGKGIEVNTSGLDRAGHVLPHRSIIQRYFDLGGTVITVGSDAHVSRGVGEGIESTVGLLQEVGFSKITVFKEHTASFVPL